MVLLDREFLKEVIGPYVIKIVVGGLMQVAGIFIAVNHAIVFVYIALGREDFARSLLLAMFTPMRLYLPVAVGGVFLTTLGYIVMYRGFKEGVRWLEGRGE